MFNPFFEPEKMSFAELHAKIDSTSLQLNQARMCNMNYTIIQTMEDILFQCNLELNDRIELLNIDELKKQKCVFDAETYLTTKKDEVKDDRKRKSKYRPEW